VARRSAILVHPTSLAGSFGIGDLGPGAPALLDWLEAAAQGVWQILPLSPVGEGGSPYDAASAFAMSPLLLSPERLHEDGLLPASELAQLERPSARRLDLADVARAKAGMLRTVWAGIDCGRSAPWPERIAAFLEDRTEAFWLPAWCLYRALERHLGVPSWREWPDELRRREPASLDAARRELDEEVRFHAWVQLLVLEQWQRVRDDANRRGIRICGDLPLYVATDSADLWAHRDLFAVDENGGMQAVAGVPPDAFTADGQRWGNPLYHWERHRTDGFAWWVERLRRCLRLVDLVRFDHFRGLEAYWEIPASDPTARSGHWVKAPGRELLERLSAELGSLPLIAEDLGVITPEVHALRRAFDLPGMRVLQFAFDELDSEHLPHHHARDTVVYTGTHDNDTTRGWLGTLDEPRLRRVLDYLGTDERGAVRQMIRAAETSVADLAVLPIQDVLELASEARMNTPGVAAGNWRFRLLPGELDAEHAELLRRLAELSGRAAPW
jgi:4-alpha-glucanotransferase